MSASPMGTRLQRVRQLIVYVAVTFVDFARLSCGCPDLAPVVTSDDRTFAQPDGVMTKF